MRDLADELVRAKVMARLFGGDHAPRLGRLTLLDRVGAGAMGTVYTAYDPRLDRKVAVKVLHAGGADANARFLREARALAKLAHPNVVTIHDVGSLGGSDADSPAAHDDAVFLVMELATGVPLRAWIASRDLPGRDWRAVVRVMREVAAGLAAAHRAGIVHRDVKPDNILVGDDRARLVDFGLAGAESAGAGTPSYMAPEVLAGEPATPASDQFSFAVTLYEALHGERPHAGTTRTELRAAALVAAKATPSSRRTTKPSTPNTADTLPDASTATLDNPSGERSDTVTAQRPTPDSAAIVQRPTPDSAAIAQRPTPDAAIAQRPTDSASAAIAQRPTPAGASTATVQRPTPAGASTATAQRPTPDGATAIAQRPTPDSAAIAQRPTPDKAAVAQRPTPDRPTPDGATAIAQRPTPDGATAIAQRPTPDSAAIAPRPTPDSAAIAQRPTPDNAAVAQRPTPAPLLANGKHPAAPAWVHAIVRRGLAADPTQRFASMDEIAAELGRDRTRKRWFVATAAIALAIGGAGGALAYRSRSGAPEVSCSGAARRDEAWNAVRADRVRAQLGDASWADTAVHALGATADRWEHSFTHVCEATRVRGEQSDRLLELRMRCLDRVLARFDALATAMATPLDATGRAEAAGATAQLPGPERCESLADEAELALPADAPARAEVLAIERGLDAAWAEHVLARYAQARRDVAALEARAANIDAPAQRAAIAVLAASIAARIDEPGVARAALDRALVAAAAAHAAELELFVWSRRLRLELFAGDPARAIDEREVARAAAVRAGRDGGDVDAVVGEALRKQGQLHAARTQLQRALASHDPMTGDQRALVEMNLGSIDLAIGKATAADAGFQHALAASRGELGEGHPTLGVYLDKRARAAVARGRIRDALELHARSLALRERAFGPDDRAVASARFYRAETLVEAGRLTDAARDLDAAYAIRARLFGDHSARLGEVVAAQGDVAAARGDRAAARTAYHRALALDRRLDLDARLIELDPRNAGRDARDPTHHDPRNSRDGSGSERGGGLDARDPTRGPRDSLAGSGSERDGGRDPTHGPRDSLDRRDRDATGRDAGYDLQAEIERLTAPDAFSIDRVAAIAARIDTKPLAEALYARWQAAGGVDAALSLPVAEALARVGDREAAALVDRAALAALADEPSRTRLHILRALAEVSDGDAAAAARRAAAAIAAALPELTRPNR